MSDARRRTGPIGREFQELARGSLSGGYQTAIMNAMTCIDHVMEEKGITRKELAERMGVHPSRISRLLNDPDNITIRTFYRLCNAVGVEPSICVDRGIWSLDDDGWIAADLDAASEAGESGERKSSVAA